MKNVTPMVIAHESSKHGFTLTQQDGILVVQCGESLQAVADKMFSEAVREILTQQSEYLADGIDENLPVRDKSKGFLARCKTLNHELHSTIVKSAKSQMDSEGLERFKESSLGLKSLVFVKSYEELVSYLEVVKDEILSEARNRKEWGFDSYSLRIALGIYAQHLKDSAASDASDENSDLAHALWLRWSEDAAFLHGASFTKRLSTGMGEKPKGPKPKNRRLSVILKQELSQYNVEDVHELVVED